MLLQSDEDLSAALPPLCQHTAALFDGLKVSLMATEKHTGILKVMCPGLGDAFPGSEQPSNCRQFSSILTPEPKEEFENVDR